MTIAVESMRWWHIPEVVAIEAATFPSDAWTVEQFWQELAQSTRSYVVGLDDGVVVGYAGCFVLAPDADVQTVAVRPDRQGQGLGAALMGSLVDLATDRRAAHLTLEVRSDNASALALYERLGFERLSVRRRYYPDGTDAVIMRRGLRQADGGTP